MDVPASDYVDVLIVGAGLSGIGAACRLQDLAPGSRRSRRPGFGCGPARSSRPT